MSDDQKTVNKMEELTMEYQVTLKNHFGIKIKLRGAILKCVAEREKSDYKTRYSKMPLGE